MDEKMIQDQINKLSSDYKAFVESDITEMTARIFGQKLGLEGKQIEVFENGLMLYLLFFLNKQQFAGFLTTECNIPARDANLTVAAIHSGLPKAVADGLDEFEVLVREQRKLPGDEAVETEMQNTPETVTSEETGASTAPAPVPKPIVDPSLVSAPLQGEPEPAAPATPPSASAPATPPPASGEQVVQPIRTMQADMDHIHGYGAYRKMFPDADTAEENVVHAASQDDVLGKKDQMK